MTNVKMVLALVVLAFASSAASAASCPSGTKYQCAQGPKGKVVCSCR